jgi:hypothetical protein
VRKLTLETYSAEEPFNHEQLETRYLRTANFFLATTFVNGSISLSRYNSDEYMVIVPPSLKVSVQAGENNVMSDGNDLFIVPPGASSIEVTGRGHLVRIFSNQAQDLLAFASNNVDYADGAPEVAEFTPWPAPVDGYCLRHYPLDLYVNPELPGRAFRSSNLMVNITDVYPEQRDSKRLKPHSHQDFEQITLTCAGRFVHHLRTPWGVDSTQWQEDRHLDVGSPAALTIPAGLIHTSQAMEQGCWLVDVFGPPRLDFSLMPGFVRNADEYPMPEVPER